LSKGSKAFCRLNYPSWIQGWLLVNHAGWLVAVPRLVEYRIGRADTPRRVGGEKAGKLCLAKLEAS